MSGVVILSGSPNPGSRLIGILQAAETLLHETGVKTDWIRIAELPAEDLVGARFDSAAVPPRTRGYGRRMP